jgi:hypothetical protein
MTRYWDGQRWSEQVAPMTIEPAPAAAPSPTSAFGAPTEIYPAGTMPPPATSDADKLALWGYITAVLFWPVGVILGFKLRKMGDPRGTKVLIVTGVVLVLAIIAALSDPSSASALTGPG